MFTPRASASTLSGWANSRSIRSRTRRSRARSRRCCAEAALLVTPAMVPRRTDSPAPAPPPSPGATAAAGGRLYPARRRAAAGRRPDAGRRPPNRRGPAAGVGSARVRRLVHQLGQVELVAELVHQLEVGLEV